MRRGTKVFLTLFFLLFLLFAAGAAVSLWFFMTPQVEQDSLLVVDLRGTLVEHRMTDSLSELFGEKAVTVADTVNGILAARDDDRIEGLLLFVQSSGGLNLARAQEIRQALELFREAGKPTHAYLESASTVEYYLASACENVYLMPGGELWTTGFYMEMPFIRDTLDKLGIEPDFYAYHDYKSAADPYRRRGMSEADREQRAALLDTFWNEFRDSVARSRNLEPATVEEIVDRSPLIPEEAHSSGLVDALLYWDQVKDRLDGTVDDEASARFTWLSDYTAKIRDRGGRKIAVVYALGAIVPGESQQPLFGSPVLGSDTISRAIRKAREDDSIEAVILRVNSPGGSARASDQIWREVVLTRESGKPVVVSMSWLAASGGYWISMAADHIVADPVTITGSIGVVAGKLDWSGFYDWIGVNHDSLQRGRNAGMFTDTSKFSESEAERLQAWMTWIYDEFVEKVSEGRDLPEERVREIARGRVWSGQDALDIGLVDELGGLREAVAAARELAGIPASDKVRTVAYPRPKTFFEALADGSRRDLGGAEALPDPVRRALHQARVYEAWEDDAALVLDPLLWDLSLTPRR